MNDPQASLPFMVTRAPSLPVCVPEQAEAGARLAPSRLLPLLPSPQVTQSFELINRSRPRTHQTAGWVPPAAPSCFPGTGYFRRSPPPPP